MSVLTALCILSLSFAYPSSAKEVNVRAGTNVNLENVSELRASTVNPGQMVDFRVTQDVMVDGQVVINAGSIAKGQVMRADSPRGLGKPGLIEVRIKHVDAVDGTRINLSGGSIYNEGEDRETQALLLGILLCLLFLTQKGKDGIIPAGYDVSASVASNTVVKV